MRWRASITEHVQPQQTAATFRQQMALLPEAVFDV